MCNKPLKICSLLLLLILSSSIFADQNRRQSVSVSIQASAFVISPLGLTDAAIPPIETMASPLIYAGGIGQTIQLSVDPGLKSSNSITTFLLHQSEQPIEIDLPSVIKSFDSDRCVVTIVTLDN